MLSDRGMSSGNAALVMSTLGSSIVVARVIIGFIIDRYFAPFVAAICFLVAVVGVSLLATGAVGSLAFLAAVLIGFSMGAEIDMLAFLTGRYFGVENFGQVYGILFTSFLIGTSIGPVAYGIAFETTGSYIWMLIVSIVMMLISTVITVLLPRYS
jgi:predicted MFS family arabinose efflux permease